MRPLLFILIPGLSLLLSIGPALADPDAPPPLGTQIEQLFVSVARERGHDLPVTDPGVAAAAADLCRLASDEGPPPGGELISEALHLHGVVEPSPHTVLSSFAAGSESAFLADLRRQVPDILGEGRWRKLGVAVLPVSPSQRRVLILLLESFVRLGPLPRSVPMGGAAAEVALTGQVLPPYQKPEVLLTDPHGQVARVALSTAPTEGGAIRISGPVRCLLRGRYQIEVLGEDRYGSTVLANFPLYCGEPPPRELVTAREARAPVNDPSWRTAAEAEQQLLGLLQADRARFGLPRLALDEHLTDVARKNSADMAERGVVGHISPRTGSPADRVKRAGIAAVVVEENLARAYSPREAEDGLLSSPGHRANLLSKDVSRVGIGVKMTERPGGVRELWVTQLFTEPPEPFDAQRSPQQVLQRVQDLRAQAGLGKLTPDTPLTNLAEQVISGLNQGTLTEARVGNPAQQAMPQLGKRFRLVRTVLALSSDLRHLSPSPSLSDPEVTHIGLSVAPSRAQQGSLYVVLVLAQGGKGKK